MIVIPGFANSLVPYLLRIMPRSITRKIVSHFNKEVLPKIT